MSPMDESPARELTMELFTGVQSINDTGRFSYSDVFHKRRRTVIYKFLFFLFRGSIKSRWRE